MDGQGSSLNILVNALLRGGPGGQREHLKRQLQKITGLYVRVNVQIDPEQVRQAVQQTTKVDQNFQKTGRTVEGITRKTKQYNQAVRDTSNSVVKQTHQWNKMAKELTMIEQLSIALKRIPVWMAGMTAFYAPLRSVRQGLQDIYEIDTQLTNLQKVAEGTREEFEEFAYIAADIGQELGVMTQEVVRSSVEFARLGYSMHEAAALAEEALLLSSVGVMEIEQATRSLIAMVQGFGVEVDQQGRNVRQVVDMVTC